MKVFLLTQMYSNIEVSGGVRTTWNYSQELARQGVHVFIFANNIKVDKLPQRPNLRVYRVPFSRYGHEVMRDDALKSFLFSIPLVLWHRPDIIHVVPVQGVSPFSKFKFGAKFVEDFEIAWDYNNLKCKDDLWRDRKRKDRRLSQFSLFQKVFLRFSIIFYKILDINEKYQKGIDAFFCRTKSEIDHLQANGTKSDCFYIPIGVNLDEFKLAGPKVAESKKFIFLNTGLLCYRKGTHYLIRAYQMFDRKYPDQSELHLIGPADQETLPELKEIAQETSSIRFFNSIPPDEVATYVAKSDVYVSPVLLGERGPVQPNVLEAMAMAKPVIISEFDDVRDWPEKKIALTCKIADHDSLFAAMEKIYLDQELRAKLGINVYQYAKENFSWTVIVCRAIESYQKVLNK